MINYYTQAWVDEVVARLRASEQFLATARKLNGTFVFRVLEGPAGADRVTTWTFRHGECVDSSYHSEPAPWEYLRHAEYNNAWIMRSTCPYSMMADLNRGVISPVRALASPHYHIEGRKTMLLQMMRPLNMWNEIAASVEVEYNHDEA
ncbi:MAG: hypothetical protein IPF82_05980 [Blastocatellia bacterium]|nr:hypothetical protein [Blastocatellia bacterium]